MTYCERKQAKEYFANVAQQMMRRATGIRLNPTTPWIRHWCLFFTLQATRAHTYICMHSN